jgi:hypothetical protein
LPVRALVVYESTFGNTRRVAESIRDGLAETVGVDIRSVDDTTPVVLADYGLIVVGGPTHAYGMSTSVSRAQARDGQPGHADAVGGIDQWLPRLGPEYAGMIAAFDTRYGRHRSWPGSASRAIRQQLRRAGLTLLDRHSFLVSTATGPLRDGELYQARIWGTGLAVRVRSRAHRGTPAGKRLRGR